MGRPASSRLVRRTPRRRSTTEMRGSAGAADEGDGIVGEDGDVFGAGDDRDGAAEGEGGGVVDGDGVVGAIGDD